MERLIEIKKVSPTKVSLLWSSGEKSDVASELLRKNCPCASCRLERGDESHEQPLSPKKRSLLKVIEHTKDEQVSLKQIWPIGNYAIGIAWADGHDTGIYSFELLREICNTQLSNEKVTAEQGKASL